MTYIKVIQHHEATDRLKDIYDGLVKKRGKLAEVHKIQSLNPESIVNHMDLYMTIMFGKSPIKRYQREMIAVIVSSGNQCRYCITHHGEALDHFWKDEEKVQKLIEDFKATDISDIDKALCHYARDLTLNPGKGNFEQHSEKLKSLGLEDRAILDCTLVVGYFNFVNRMVTGLGVELEVDGGKGYEYD